MTATGSLSGMSALTGAALSGLDHLAQSVGDILFTPIGTRTMRRDYGSMLFDLIDQPFNSATRLLIYAATAAALRRWEPRLRITRVTLDDSSSPAQGPAQGLAGGAATLLITGERTDLAIANQRILFSAPIRAGGITPFTATPLPSAN